MPDYANEISKTWETEYTATVDGWVYAYGFSSNNLLCSLIMNGKTYPISSVSGAGNYVATAILMPIAKGETYKGTSGYSLQVLKFIPLKGAS
jgi:hypothetical protein